jgi:hypothetical protein
MGWGVFGIGALGVCTLPGCVWNLADGCSDTDEPVTIGRDMSLDGVSPDRLLAPRLISHDGTLTWNRSGASTPFHVVLERGPGSAQTTVDCDGRRTGFSVPATVSIRSGDGLVAGSQSISIAIDIHNQIESVQGLVFDLSFATLMAAGLTPPDIISGPQVEYDLTLQAVDLAPVASPISMLSYENGAERSSALGSVAFP